MLSLLFGSLSLVSCNLADETNPRVRDVEAVERQGEGGYGASSDGLSDHGHTHPDGYVHY